MSYAAKLIAKALLLLTGATLFAVVTNAKEQTFAVSEEFPDEVIRVDLTPRPTIRSQANASPEPLKLNVPARIECCVGTECQVLSPGDCRLLARLDAAFAKAKLVAAFAKARLGEEVRQRQKSSATVIPGGGSVPSIDGQRKWRDHAYLVGTLSDCRYEILGHRPGRISGSGYWCSVDVRYSCDSPESSDIGDVPRKIFLVGVQTETNGTLVLAPENGATYNLRISPKKENGHYITYEAIPAREVVCQ